MKPEDIPQLPADLAELERLWPRLLEAILEDIDSPADPVEIIENLKKDQGFINLVGGWENMPTAAQANAWEMIQDRLRREAWAGRQFCRRCGECCRRGSPALFEQDRPILHQGILKPENLTTLRSGQPAYSNRSGRMIEVRPERIKIKEAPESRTCIFLGPGGDACLIYQDRPHQCRVMECWDPGRFDTLLKMPPLNRFDIIDRDSDLGQILARHEERCSLDVFGRSLSDSESSEGSARGMEMINFDLHAREFLSQKFGITEPELEFYLGFPLAALCRAFGFVLQPRTDQGFKLVKVGEGTKDQP